MPGRTATPSQFTAALESTNPHNLHRCQQLGCHKLGELTLPAGPSVDRLWRDSPRYLPLSRLPPVPFTTSEVSGLQNAG
jgi:hypothetical protein